MTAALSTTPLPARRPKPLAVQTSVLVPCIGKHVDLLPDLLRHLAGQTCRPDEVVISVSSCPALPPAIDRAVRASAIPTRVLVNAGTAYAGRNRNCAADASKGDVLIYQDADDLPHPQRVELVRRAFAEYFITHLIHYYTHATKPASWYGPGVAGSLSDRYDDRRFRGALQHQPQYVYSLRIHNGNIATSRAVFNVARWDETMRRAQDFAYNKVVYNRFKRNVVLSLPLIHYRQHLSSETR